MRRDFWRRVHHRSYRKNVSFSFMVYDAAAADRHVEMQHIDTHPVSYGQLLLLMSGADSDCVYRELPFAIDYRKEIHIVFRVCYFSHLICFK